MTKKKTSPYTLAVIHSLSEIPSRFDSEDDEREFWSTHELSDELWNTLPQVGEHTYQLPDLKYRTEVCDWHEIPNFKSQHEEEAWWEEHVLSQALVESLPDRPVLATRLETLREMVRLGREAQS